MSPLKNIKESHHTSIKKCAILVEILHSEDSIISSIVPFVATQLKGRFVVFSQ